MQTAEPIKIIFMCEFCFQGYVHASDLISHKKEKHEFGVNELKAPATPPLFESKVSTSTENRNLKEMKKSAIKIPTKKPRYKRKSKLEVEGSSLTFNEKSNLNTSKKKLHQDLRFKPGTVSGQLCPQAYTNQNLLDRHELVAHGPSSSVIKTEAVEALNESENEVTGHGSSLASNDRSCKTCDKTFNRPSRLEAHNLIHHTVNRPTFKCKVCSKEFRDQKWFRGHEKSHSAKPKMMVKDFKCTVKICPASFSNRHQLKQHMECHSAEKPYVCHKCQFKTKHKRVLQRHLVRHGKPTPHKCRFCSKPFAHKSLLENHERTHTGQRPFKCQVKTCGLTFMSKDTLSLHTRVKHFTTLGLEEFSCSLCKKRTSFGIKRLLEKHIKIHHSEHKPFRCSYPGCTKEYTEKRSLVEHATLHSGETLYACEDCGLRFRSRTQRRGHRQKDCQD